MTITTEAPASTQAATWLADNLLTRHQIGGGLYPSSWADNYKADFRNGAQRVLDGLAALNAPGDESVAIGRMTHEQIGEWVCSTVGGLYADFVPAYHIAVGQWFRSILPDLLLTMYPLGSRWRVNTERPENATLSVGDTVQRVDATYNGRNGGVGAREGYPMRVYVQRVGDNDVAGGAIYFVGPQHLDPLGGGEPATLRVDVIDRADHLREVNGLNATIERLRGEVEEYRALAQSRAEEHQSDIDAISERFMDEANARDWCGDYDAIVTDLNRSLNREMKTREQDYEVTWQETYLVTVTRTERVTRAYGSMDGDEAQDVAENADVLEEYELIDLLRSNGSHEYQDDSVDNVDFTSV